MKKLFYVVCLVLGLSLVCWAGSPVSFRWDPNTESDLVGYRLYQTDTSGEYTLGEGNAVAIIPSGTNTVTITDVPDGEWWWVLTAYDLGNLESGPSNEVTDVLDTAPEVPKVLTIQ